MTYRPRVLREPIRFHSTETRSVLAFVPLRRPKCEPHFEARWNAEAGEWDLTETDTGRWIRERWVQRGPGSREF